MEAIIKKEINQLSQKIADYKNEKISEDKFKHFRLTRGVYGQRQPGVQMVRIKLPFGRTNAEQLATIAKLSDKYAGGKVHLTTRQNIQLHFVKLSDTPMIWEELARVGVTIRESCGNTVRGITASPTAGIDPDEPFDVSPYADQTFRFFLRNPICQDMGRKFKIAFSSNSSDTAFAYIHDLGFVPVIKDGKKGFKVFLGGGLGAQAFTAYKVRSFLPVEELLPFSEAVVRAFDLHGERKNRNKARLKFLLQKIGVNQFMNIVEGLAKSVKSTDHQVRADLKEFAYPETDRTLELKTNISDSKGYSTWLNTNSFAQKQQGYHGVYIRVQNGDIDFTTALRLSEIIQEFSHDEARVTQNQGLLLRFVPSDLLYKLYEELGTIGLNRPGAGSTHDLTTCPGVDTCNLAVTNSTGLGREIEALLAKKYPEFLHSKGIQIKISGCMNSCGQHMAADIGFHGSSLKIGERVVPAMQAVLGGGVANNGKGLIAEKVIKVPTKRAPKLVDTVLGDFNKNKEDNEPFSRYYSRKGKAYFYDLLKHLGDKENILIDEFSDWAKPEQKFVPEIGIGECAGVIVDSVESVLNEAEENHRLAERAAEEALWADAAFHYYTAFIVGAKALLLDLGIETNTRNSILELLDKNIRRIEGLHLGFSFSKEVSRIHKEKPDEKFVKAYSRLAAEFCAQITKFRHGRKQKEEKVIVGQYRA